MKKNSHNSKKAVFLKLPKKHKEAVPMETVKHVEPVKHDVGVKEDTKHVVKDAPKSLKTQRVTVVGGNTDGVNLFMEIDSFDGEHNNKFYPVFPYKTTSEEIIQYMKNLIDNDPRMPAEIVGLMQTGIFWDAAEEVWMIKPMTGPAKAEKVKGDKHEVKPVVHTPSHG